MLGLVIVIDKEKIELENDVFNYKITSEDKEGHLSLLKKFIIENNISLDYKNKTSYELSIELAKLGIMNLHFENRNIIIYLPETLCCNQGKYIKNNINFIKRHSLKIASIQDDNVNFFEEEIDDYNVASMINVLMKEVKKKLKLRGKEENKNGREYNKIS